MIKLATATRDDTEVSQQPLLMWKAGSLLQDANLLVPFRFIRTNGDSSRQMLYLDIGGVRVFVIPGSTIQTQVTYLNSQLHSRKHHNSERIHVVDTVGRQLYQ